MSTERLDELEEFLAWVEQQQPNALGIIRRNGFVFDDLGAEPGNWKHLAFTLYSMLCEIDSHAVSLIQDRAEA